MTPVPAAAFFDVDGTLLDGNVVRYYADLRTQDFSAAHAALWKAVFALRVPWLVALDRQSRARFQRALYRGYRHFAPAELEALLVTHPAVTDAAVIGRPDERHGEVPVAFVVGTADLDPEAVRTWLGERVAPYKRVAEVVPVDTLPRTPSGKLLRRLLADKPVAPANAE